MADEDDKSKRRPTMDKRPELPMEMRLAIIETEIRHVQNNVTELKVDVRDLRAIHDRDFRISFGALIVAALGLAGIMAKGFHWI
jgi:hypothetical protein